jgi:hypothetical protein
MTLADPETLRDHALLVIRASDLGNVAGRELCTTPSSNVLCVKDRFEVIWVDAVAITT